MVSPNSKACDRVSVLETTSGSSIFSSGGEVSGAEFSEDSASGLEPSVSTLSPLVSGAPLFSCEPSVLSSFGDSLSEGGSGV